MVLNGQGARRATLGRATIAGDLYDAVWSISGTMGNLKVKGVAEDMIVRSTDSMGSITLGAAINSDFQAGVHSSVGSHPGSVGDFVNTDARIRKVTIKGLKLPGIEEDPYFFENSNFSAASIGRVSVLNLWANNGGEEFGFYALHKGLGGGAIASVAYRDTFTGERWTWKPIEDDPMLNILDFVAGSRLDPS